MITITKEFKDNLSKQETQENISKFLAKISKELKEKDLIYLLGYSCNCGNKLNLYLRLAAADYLNHAENKADFEQAKKIIYKIVSESKEIIKTDYNFIAEKELKTRILSETTTRIVSEFSAELTFKTKEITDKAAIEYLYQESVKAAKERLEYKFIEKIETDRKKYLFNILNNTIYRSKAEIEKLVKDNLHGDQFYIKISDNCEYNIDLTDFETETAEYNKKAEKYNKNLIENYIKETDPDLYFAKFTKETKKETVKETVKQVKAETVKETVIEKETEITENYYFSLNFHELNKFIKAGSDFMKLPAELRFQLYNYRQFLFEKTYR